MLFGSGQENEEWAFFCLGSVVCLKLAACLANLRNKVRYVSEQVEKYWGGSVWGLSGRCHMGWLDQRCHMGWLDHRLGEPKLMPCSAGPGCDHETQRTQRVSPGVTAAGAPCLQAFQQQEPAQPGRTNWKGSIGDLFRGQSINNLSSKETADYMTCWK